MYNEGFASGLKAGYTNEEVVRKMFLTYPTFVFIDNYDVSFEILDSIAGFFSIPINAIQVVGSGKFGYSYFKSKKFSPSDSDLDIAIINPELFVYYSEIVFKISKGLKNRTGFKYEEGKPPRDDFNSYKHYISQGIFRPDFMPFCGEKTNWFNFFNRLSNEYTQFFKSINAGIYMSQPFFEYRQSKIIQEIKYNQK